MCHIFRTRRRTAIVRRGRGLASPRIAHQTARAAHDTPHTAHHAPARGLPEPQRNNRTLPNNVARNSPRSFFDYASKRCNSNAANSKFEIVTRELRATLIEQARRHPTTPGGKQAQRQAGPQAPRQDPGVRRHREPGRLVTTVNAAMASSIEESGRHSTEYRARSRL